MSFIEPNLEVILEKLGQLNSSQKPLWGEMNAQRMVEHLTDILRFSTGKDSFALLIGEDKIEKMHSLLESDTPMPKNFEAPFAGKDVALRNEDLDLAIDEFVEEWIDFEENFESDSEKTIVHAYYGPLNFEQWKRVHAKHVTHHFQQFGLM